MLRWVGQAPQSTLCSLAGSVHLCSEMMTLTFYSVLEGTFCSVLERIVRSLMSKCGKSPADKGSLLNSSIWLDQHLPAAHSQRECRQLGPDMGPGIKLPSEDLKTG